MNEQISDNWINASDCWHVSKELNGFMAPKIKDYSKATKLARSLVTRRG